MTTKEQERKALEQIKKIVAGLGEDSYVGTALEGCFEMAEQNIEYDAAFSMMAERDFLQEAEDELYKEKKALEKQVNELQAKLKEQEEKYNKHCENAAATVKELSKSLKLAHDEALDNLKEIHLELKNKDRYNGRFASIRYIDHNGFRFVNVEQESGWVDSYKLDDIVKMEIK